MKVVHALVSLLAASLPLWAGTIASPPVNVSSSSTQVLNPEDKLFFTVSDWSYQVSAAIRGLPAQPTQIAFQFISAPQSDPGDFAVFLESRDGTVIDSFPDAISWSRGRYQSLQYTGSVSVLYGALSLSAAQAAELFSGPSVVLELENMGSSTRVGLMPYTLGQDLTVSFSGSGFGVSGPVGQVMYVDPPAGVPEPDSAWLVLAVGLLGGAAGYGLHRVSGRRI